MPSISPPTLTRLDPAYPMLWRDVDTVQFGLDGRVRVPLDEPWVEPLLQAMRAGFRRASFDVVAHGAGAPREAARALLHALATVLRTDAQRTPPVWVESVNLADSRVEARMLEALADEDVPLVGRSTPGAVGIVLVHGAASARQLARYQHDDISHLPVAFEPGGTTIGPLIVPGRTPCLSCRDAHQRDQDPAWPTMHAQLIGATAHRIGVVHAAEAAGLITRILAEPGTGGRTGTVRITPDGRRVRSAVAFHEECQCRGLSFRSPEGIATGSDPRVPPSATTTHRAFARRA